MTVNWEDIQNKWSNRWLEEGSFEANSQPGKKKFFVTFPYPYVNSILHIGHLFTLMRVEAFARYKRLQGFNVLFPQGWHATGSPIVNAAQRVAEKEPKQLQLLRDVGIPEHDLKLFENSEYWLDYFIPEAIKDYQTMGMSVDWRRQFHTTSLNPHYDKFIAWQFNRLKEKKKVIKGKFPVVWCPKDNTAVGDHARSEGEGETPLEYLLIKHRLKDGRFLISSTLRPDTILGITNLYVNPNTTYQQIEINNEIWILGAAAVKRLQEQGHNLSVKGNTQGQDLIGQKTLEFGGREVLILPATFLKEEFGAGLVHSVPSDSADDLIALQDLQRDENKIAKYGLNIDEVKNIKAIAVLKTPGFSDIPAQDFLTKYQVRNQNERKKLEQIKKEMYKLSHHTSTLNELYQENFSKDLAGMKVEEAKEIIRDDLLKEGWLVPYYELSGDVKCRCLTECFVKIVDDQWFLAYGDKEWKEQAHQALKKIKLYPEKARAQFEYVIDWLHNWACTRENGLGTRLPWDDKWLIESLSDSTIYMAYYTIVHLLEDTDISLIDDKLFDFVFLGKEVPIKIDKESAQKMRDEFNYWYPVDFRNSGKDLIQNHLAFYIFNHTVLFPEDKWPVGIGVNGWVSVDGEKMSKSKGNIIPLREMPSKFGVDCSRFTILSGGEDMDDPNWDSSFALALRSKLEQFHDFCLENYNKGRAEKKQIDNWFDNQITAIIQKTTQFMEETLFRSALQSAYFELNNILKWYQRRCGKVSFNKESISRFIEVQVTMLCPVTPFICSEIWEKINPAKEMQWPKVEEMEDNLNTGEYLLKQILTDMNHVLKLAKIEKPTKISLFIAPDWKYNLFKELQIQIKESRNPGDILKKIMQINQFREHGKEISKTIPALVTSGNIPAQVTGAQEEYDYLQKAKDFLEEEFNCQIDMELDSDHPKAKSALPGKVGILVE